MVQRNIRKWRSPLSLLAALAALSVALASSGVAGAQKCKNITGTITLTPVNGPACASPVGICATGSFQGVLKGDSSFTASTVTTSVDTPTTGVLFVTGDNVLQTAGGTLTTKTAAVLQTTGAGRYAEVATIVGATGEWAGATGGFTVTGTFTQAGGSGRYEGEICTP